jgi:hypothetical protein
VNHPPRHLTFDLPLWRGYITFDSPHYARSVRAAYRRLRRYGMTRGTARDTVRTLVSAGEHSNYTLGAKR